MKTADLERYFRNQTTPAARLARWQRHRSPARLHQLRAAPAYRGDTIAARRRYHLDHLDTGPELSSPNSPTPYLWTTEDSPLVSHFWPGRDFLRHRGWYTDEHQEETLEACAVILTDFPHLIFPAVRDSCSDSLRIDLSDWREIDFSAYTGFSFDADDARRDAARDAVRTADSIAERDAERSQTLEQIHNLENA